MIANLPAILKQSTNMYTQKYRPSYAAMHDSICPTASHIASHTQWLMLDDYYTRLMRLTHDSRLVHLSLCEGQGNLAT